jgi:hypothetical protein
LLQFENSSGESVEQSTQFLAERAIDSETNGYERGTAGVDDGRYLLLLNKEVVQQLIMMNVLLL